MSAELTKLEFDLFRNYIQSKCGIEIGEDKAYLIETRLSGLMAELKLNSFEELYRYLILNTNGDLSGRIIDAITTNETLWFRDKIPWQYLEQVLMPQYIELLRTGKKQKIRILSGAASTGQEAYSTAMCIDRYLSVNMIHDVSISNFEIIGTDISRTVLNIAEKGIYNSISIMRGLTNEYRDKYFIRSDSIYSVIDRIKSMVKFRQFNLQNSFIPLGNFDIIFMRYVMIYFSDVLKADIVNKMIHSLNDDGVVFIGASELFKNMNEMFAGSHFGGGTIYTKRGANL